MFVVVLFVLGSPFSGMFLWFRGGSLYVCIFACGLQLRGASGSWFRGGVFYVSLAFEWAVYWLAMYIFVVSVLLVSLVGCCCCYPFGVLLVKQA